jgi:hypothetical protein
MLAFYLSAAADLMCFWMFAFLSLYINLYNAGLLAICITL